MNSNIKPISPSRQAAAKVIYAALQKLKVAGGSMRVTDLVEHIRHTVSFTDWENEPYQSTGQLRWITMLHFYSVDSQKAGFLQKNKGVWTITPEGEDALKMSPKELIDAASKAYHAWKNERTDFDKEGVFPTDAPEDEDIIPAKEISFEQQQAALLGQYESVAMESIRQHILHKNPYEFQDMVGALLAAMGYHISHIAPRGRDGGIDLIVYNDPLGTQPPRILVQVKHRPTSSVPPDEIQRLIGTMKRDSDVGIFVTSGDFSNYARQEARTSGKHVELIDFPRFVSLWQQYYPKMMDEQKNMLPLHPVYFLGTNE